MLNLFKDWPNEFGPTSLPISRDLGLVRFKSDEVMAMNDGQMVERGNAAEILAAPAQEVTRRLLEVIPPDCERAIA